MTPSSDPTRGFAYALDPSGYDIEQYWMLGQYIATKLRIEGDSD